MVGWLGPGGGVGLSVGLMGIRAISHRLLSSSSANHQVYLFCCLMRFASSLSAGRRPLNCIMHRVSKSQFSVVNWHSDVLARLCTDFGT